jgi:prepilin-type N-terminal cleavage/methylation domain-containing protein/prepilin-type processing-associated H-X9-DG protein
MLQDETRKNVYRLFRTGRGLGFTLVELLVVIGIIAVLVSILLPTLSSARRAATEMQCASNIKQLCTAMIMYANEHKGKFSLNIGAGKDAHWWYDADRIGRYLPRSKQNTTTSIYGGVFQCPADEFGVRSYAMNVYASAKLDDGVTLTLTAGAVPQGGKLFDSGTKGASELILFSEKWSEYSGGGGLNADNIMGATKIPGKGSAPGRRFVGDLAISHGASSGRLKGQFTPTEFDPTRHRRRGQGRTYQDYDGRVNIGFVDGHVQIFQLKELGDRATGRSTFKAMWSPADKAMQAVYAP